MPTVCLSSSSGSIQVITAEMAAAPILRDWLGPYTNLGVTTVSAAPTGGTDHVLMARIGLPAYQFIQDPLDYEPTTHHTNMDFFEALQPEDMRRNSVILASFAMMAANHPGHCRRRRVLTTMLAESPSPRTQSAMTRKR